MAQMLSLVVAASRGEAGAMSVILRKKWRATLGLFCLAG